MIFINTTAIGLHPPNRSHVEITDPDEAGAFLDRAYGSRLRLSYSDEVRRGPFLRHTRTDAGAIVIDEIQVAGDVKVSPDPLNKVVAVWPTAGRVAGLCQGVGGQATAGDVTLVSQPDLPYEAHAKDLTVTSVLFDPVLAARAAGGLTDGDAPPLRFLAFEPVSSGAARLWQDTVEYVRDSVLAEDAHATPLVLAHAGQLLATVTLAAFPHVTVEETAADRTDAKPEILRRAMDYMAANATADIALSDVASAVHVSPRAVQYMFRRHLDTTPLQYLRGLRLHRAHHDLLAAEHGQRTVAEIAARWGFAHTGRFAVLYRQTYGQSPHTTLRG